MMMFIVGGVGLLLLTIWITGQEDMTNLESGLLQFILFAAGIAVSFYLGRRSVSEAAQEVLRPHGRKSVRRIVNLAQGITSFRHVIHEQRQLLSEQAAANAGQVPLGQVEHTFATLEVVIAGQLRTAADAVEDWRDVVPAEVTALEENPEEQQ